LIFYSADAITAQRSRHVPPHFAWELRLPFVPAFTVVYLSIHLLLATAPALLPTRRELRALGLALCSGILAAGVGFILYPSQLAFPAPPDPGIWSPIFHFADELNGNYNLVPSLHVALSVTCVAVYARCVPGWRATCLWLWASAIAVSTLLTYQHHVIDVVTGWLLGIVGGRLYQRFATPANQSQV
jgi:membrane-associated phospholipid phosphatase